MVCRKLDNWAFVQRHSRKAGTHQTHSIYSHFAGISLPDFKAVSSTDAQTSTWRFELFAQGICCSVLQCIPRSGRFQFHLFDVDALMRLKLTLLQTVYQAITPTELRACVLISTVVRSLGLIPSSNTTASGARLRDWNGARFTLSAGHVRYVKRLRIFSVVRWYMSTGAVKTLTEHGNLAIRDRDRMSWRASVIISMNMN
ncbi:hypothetical protein EDD16DRAFT_294924 [Pisolithus croceorrhizus]|nr:hypothetical protein EDD16DRAFT_294924 [Pisolithus croceorrhizus]